MKHLLVCLLLSLASTATFADTREFDVCLLCHGTNANGNTAINAPKLAGLQRTYLLRQLEAFRSDLRGTHPQDVSGGEMRAIARSLDARMVAKAVDFIATLQAESTAATIAGDTVRGKALYAGCESCHGARGEGNDTLGAPRLAQGSDWYWVTQLNNYRSGLRGTSSADTYGQMMRAAVSGLTDEQAVRDVVAYINTLQ